jgi:hypothetical protein
VWPGAAPRSSRCPRARIRARCVPTPGCASATRRCASTSSPGSPPVFNPSEAWRERTGLPVRLRRCGSRARGSSSSPGPGASRAAARARLERMTRSPPRRLRAWSVPLEATRHYLSRSVSSSRASGCGRRSSPSAIARPRSGSRAATSSLAAWRCWKQPVP